MIFAVPFCFVPPHWPCIQLHSCFYGRAGARLAVASVAGLLLLLLLLWLLGAAFSEAVPYSACLPPLPMPFLPPTPPSICWLWLVVPLRAAPQT